MTEAIPAPMNDSVDTELNALRELVETARPLPMSASVVLNKSDILVALERVQRSCRTAFADAHAVVQRGDEVLATYQEKADLVLHEAELEQERRISDTEVFRLATRQAEEIRAEAEAEAESLRREADAYVEGKLSSFAITLEQTIDAVRRGQERLTASNPFAEAEDSGSHAADVWPPRD